jgi:hypothetical protein
MCGNCRKVPAMDVNVSTSIVIRRPRADVAAFAIDPDNAPKWYVNIKAVEDRAAVARRLAGGLRGAIHGSTARLHL